MDRIGEGRTALTQWELTKPENYFESDGNFQTVLRMHLGARRYNEVLSQLQQSGAVCAGELDQAVRESSRDENLPRLRRSDGLGNPLEEVVFHPAYHRAGELVWGTGVLAALAQPQGDLLSGALAYLVTHNGEAGHACPVACTSGLTKLLQRCGTKPQRERYLERLLTLDYSVRLHASQFVTEVQGGSDVGSNACIATPDKRHPGFYRLSGEKWFCSVADASLFVVSARPEGASDGTPGLGLFLVPRLVNARPNGFSIRRLKVKLGTRSMASAEIDFDGALAEPVGALEEGFKNLIGVVLDTSRLHNAVAACGGMRRALIEAQTFARSRRAFGQPILEFPMVQERLALMRMETTAAIATTFRLLALSDRLAQGASKEQQAARRVHVNINKYWTSIEFTRTARDAIEVLGGNGTIEQFSVVPRLYRDAMVVESWEGTHNTLCAQVLRDFATRQMHLPWLAEVTAAIGTIQQPKLSPHRQRAERQLAILTERIGRLLTEGEAFASRHIRRVVDEMCLLNSYVSLLLELSWEVEHQIESDKAAIVQLYALTRIDQVDPMACTELPALQIRLANSL